MDMSQSPVAQPDLRELAKRILDHLADPQVVQKLADLMKDLEIRCAELRELRRVDPACLQKVVTL